MNIQRPILAILGALSFATLTHAQKTDGPPPDEKRIYKEAGTKKLEIWIWKPAGWKADDKRAAMVFYHGGGWRNGSPTLLSRQSARLAERGMVGFSVQYRLTSQPGITIEDCVKDAKSAFRWVKGHAAELGVDPAKIAAGGGSAGGHLAAALATLDDINDPGDNIGISTVPVALALFNPAVKLDFKGAERVAALPKADLLKLSPYHHLKAGHPPTLIFHGDADTTVPIQTAHDYVAKIKDLGGLAEVAVSAGQGHGFFNRSPHFEQTLQQTETFLEKQKLLTSP